MATGAPPDGWNMTAGSASLWGTDVYQVSSGGIGSGGVVLATNKAAMVSDWVSLDTTLNDTGYVATIKFSIPSGQSNTLVPTIKFVQYDSTKSTVVQTTTVATPTSGYYNPGVNIASQIFFSVTNAPFGRWEITNPGGTNTLISAIVERIRSSLLLSNPSTTAFTASTYSPVVWSTTFTGYEAGLLSFVGSNIALRKAGVYQFAANLTVTPNSGAFTANQVINTRIVSVNSATSATTAVSPVFNHYVYAAATLSPTISWTQLVNVPTMNVITGTAAVPYFQVQVLCTTALKMVAASSSLCVSLLN